ncbi:hypothetical protein ACFE04_016718 [Oxalis oulophora]
MSTAGVAIAPIANEPVLSPTLLGPADESILVYLSVSGSMIPMRVLESDSIESVKLRIQNCQGFVVSNQKLICRGRELARSNSLVKDYGVTDGNVMHVVLKLSDLRLVKVKTTTGKELTFQVEKNKPVGYVKEEIAKREKQFGDLDEQEVIRDGETLQDQWLIDDVCKRNNEAVIHLLVRKSAKVRPKRINNDVELVIEAPQPNCERKYDEERQHEVDHQVINYEVDKVILPRKPPDGDFFLHELIGNPKIEVPSVIMNMVNSAYDGLSSGNRPVRSMEGTGGAYFMFDSSGEKIVSFFKPIDEEPMAVNNPRGLPLSEDGEGLKKGTEVGGGALREVAAYLLDHPQKGHRSFNDIVHGFSGVPPTVMVECLHAGFNHTEKITAKIGSLQMFMENSGSCEDIGPGGLPVKEVHKISVLDMRLANADRHSGNILLGKDKDGQTVLIPIDHGYCLPNSFEDCTFDWLYWPQARQHYSAEIIDYIKSLDAEEDIALLKTHGWSMPLECARTFRISTMLLKKGVEKGLTPFDIGTMMCRENLNKESVIEEIIQEAWDSVLPDTSELEFLAAVSNIMDRHLEKVNGSPI